MSHGRNKYQSREDRLIIRDILMDKWDPIGVKHLTGAEDEYDAYAGAIYVKLLNERASQDILEKYLLNTATEHMGMPFTEELQLRCKSTANILIGLRSSFETH